MVDVHVIKVSECVDIKQFLSLIGLSGGVSRLIFELLVSCHCIGG